MTTDTTKLHAVVRAAASLLEARHDQMITSQEWDELQHAVDMAVHGHPVEHSADDDIDE